MTTYGYGQAFVVELVGAGADRTDTRWLRVWAVAERLAPDAGEPPQQIVARWRRHAEVMLEFGTELEEQG